MPLNLPNGLSELEEMRRNYKCLQAEAHWMAQDLAECKRCLDVMLHCEKGACQTCSLQDECNSGLVTNTAAYLWAKRLLEGK